MKNTSFFILGVLVGAFGTMALQRARQNNPTEDVDELSHKVGQHLRQLEERLESAIQAGEGKTRRKVEDRK